MHVRVVRRRVVGRVSKNLGRKKPGDFARPCHHRDKVVRRFRVAYRQISTPNDLKSRLITFHISALPEETGSIRKCPINF